MSQTQSKQDVVTSGKPPNDPRFQAVRHKPPASQTYPQCVTENDQTVDLEELTRAVEAAIPFNRVLGLHLADLTAQGARLTFQMRDELVGNFEKGVLHGGVISASLDVAGGMASLMAGSHDPSVDIVARFRVLGTIDLRVDYLRPGAGNSFVVTGEILRSGRKVAVTRMELHNEDGTLIAVGTGTYIVA